MKSPLNYNNSILLAFFLLVLSSGISVSYLQMQQSLNDEIHFRLKQSVTSLDVTLDHARLAANRAKEYLNNNCDEGVLTGIRTIVATIPDVRSVNLARHNVIYCTSVFGGKTYHLNQADYPDGSFKLMAGNDITPSNSLVVYALQEQNGNSVLVGIDGYYLRNVLKVLGANLQLYLKVDDRIMDRNGHVSASREIGNSVFLSSRRFGYAVIADRAGLTGYYTFVSHKWSWLVAILVFSLILTWLVRNYLGYRNTLEFMLRKAIKHKQLRPYIQPIARGEDGEIVGGEVLVRWEHPKLGFIPPDKFITVAEETGLIKEVTTICFNETIRHLHGQILPHGLYICFNISAANFQDDEIVSLCERFQSHMKDIQARVVLEITERESFASTMQTESVTRKLRQLGVQFSLDDFGTGHANYNYLQQFKPDFIKIDKVFTSNIGTNAASPLVVKNMVSLAREFDCHIIAEGVENKQQLQILQALGIKIFQGYYFSRPMSVEDYILACDHAQNGHKKLREIKI